MPRSGCDKEARIESPGGVTGSFWYCPHAVLGKMSTWALEVGIRSQEERPKVVV